MMNKRTIYISFGITLLLLISLFLYTSTFIQPKIIFTAQVNEITGEDYKRITDNADVRTIGKGIEEFRDINIHIKITAPFAFIKDINIGGIPKQAYFIQPYLKNNTQIDILSGGGSGNGDTSEFYEKMEVCLKNTTEDELKNILGDLRIEVSWLNIWNNKDSKIIYLKDYLR